MPSNVVPIVNYMSPTVAMDHEYQLICRKRTQEALALARQLAEATAGLLRDPYDDWERGNAETVLKQFQKITKERMIR